MGYSPWGRQESDTTEQLHFTQSPCSPEILKLTLLFPDPHFPSPAVLDEETDALTVKSVALPLNSPGTSTRGLSFLIHKVGLEVMIATCWLAMNENEMK